MDAARAAVQKITGHRGHHTTVEETVNPAVVHETVKPVRLEEATQAVDREVHQHHYHTTVQPLAHQEKLPEQHTHNILPTENREYRHDNEEETKARIAAELSNFRDQSVIDQVQTQQTAAPTVTGEHVHHHVHETVVPVVHKETIQPEVVHTVVPVHETHHAAAQHHGLSALPMKTLDEFKQAGGVLSGGSHNSREEYDGAPRPYNEKLATTFEKLEEKFHGHGAGTTHQPTDSGVGGVGNDLGRDTGYSGNDIDSSKYANNGAGRMGTLDGGSRDGGAKPSLTDRLNPKVDADGDGQAGFMK